MQNKWTRWMPAVVAGVVVAAGAIAVPVAANASATLPSKTPAQVIALMEQSHVRAFSGTIEQKSDLGLPSLPSTGGGSDSSLSSTLDLVTGTHTVRVYADGAKNLRLQVMDQLAERDVIRHGSEVWLYDSKANTAQHATVTSHETVKRVPATIAQTSSEIATALLAKLRSTSTVSVDGQVRVAGRSAYDLVLKPRATDTLLGSVSIAVDSGTGMPLSVGVAARGQKTPAVSVGFSSLTLSTPAASLFSFTPPANAKVTQLAKPAPGSHAKASSTKPTVTGSGWDSVVTIPSRASLAGLEKSGEFGELTTAVSGGRLFHTSIVNVLFATDGRILVGSVPAKTLESAVSSK